jgi:four helix bundle protein
MTNAQETNSKKEPGSQKHAWDLEERGIEFAKDCRALIRRLHMDVPNQEDSRQLTRASGSVGANYIEANDSLGKKDFQLHIKICRKEAKESAYFLRLLHVATADEAERQRLVQEGTELKKIFSAILTKSESQ